MSSLTVGVGNFANTIAETAYATAGPGSTVPIPLTINAGNGPNTINLLSLAGTTTVNTGDGPEQVTADPTNPNSTLTINCGSGDNTVELDQAPTTDDITINLGNGNSTAIVDGTTLDLDSTVWVNGGTGNDTLLFATHGKPIYAFDPSGAPVPDGVPVLPDGAIQVVDIENQPVNYTLISNIPGFSAGGPPTGYTAPTVSVGGPYTIDEGQGLTLSGVATPGTGATVAGAAWDFNGAGTFPVSGTLVPNGSGGDSVLAPVTWAQLVALGVNGPGTYPIALEVTDSDGAHTTVYTSLTIDSVAATVSVSGSGSATLGAAYPITFSATEPPGAGYGLTG
jgi:hypothetical protein